MLPGRRHRIVGRQQQDPGLAVGQAAAAGLPVGKPAIFIQGDHAQRLVRVEVGYVIRPLRQGGNGQRYGA